MCGSQNRSFQNQARIPAILLCPPLSWPPRPAGLSAAQGAPRCARAWPESVPAPPPPPPPRPLLSKARGEPRSLLPLAALGKGAASPVTWQPGPHALIGWSPRQAGWHTRPARPRPQGRAPPPRPGRGAPLRRACPALDAPRSGSVPGKRRGAGPPHPPQPAARPHMLRSRPRPHRSSRGLRPPPVRR